MSRGIHEFRAGDRVQYSGRFLKSAGMQRGSAGRAVFTVLRVEGNYATVDAPADTSWFTPAELAADPSLAKLRIHTGNLVRVGTRSSRNTP